MLALAEPLGKNRKNGLIVAHVEAAALTMAGAGCQRVSALASASMPISPSLKPVWVFSEQLLELALAVGLFTCSWH